MDNISLYFIRAQYI